MPTYRVLIHRDMTYEAASAKVAREEAISDLWNNLNENPGANDDVIDVARGVRESIGAVELEPADED
jgi:hypothetical protein